MVQLTVEGRWDEARAIWERILPLEEVVYGAPVRDYRARTKVALQRARRDRVDGRCGRRSRPCPRSETAAIRAALAGAGLLTAGVA